jgi:uncharacterized protein YndB with AHSA1/START domain
MTDRPSTVRLSTEVTVDRPAAEAWQVVADYARDPQWRHGVLAMVPTPAGLVTLGTTTAEEMRFAGRTMCNLGEVVALVPGRTFSWRTTEGAAARGSRTVRPLGPGRCTVRLELEVDPRPSERPLLPLLRRMLRRQLEADGRALAALVTADADSRAAHHTPRAA